MDQRSAEKPAGLLNRMDDYMRREPTKAVVTTFGAGFILNLLPLGAIAALLVSILLSLLRPALLFLGLVKACEFCGFNPYHQSKL